MKRTILAASIVAAFSGQALAATYQLTELPTMEGVKHTYVVDANQNGDAIGQTRGVFKLPIDLSYLDFEDAALTSLYDQVKREFELSDKTITFTLDDIKNNNGIVTNADAHTFMVRYLNNQAANAQVQKLSDGFAISFSAQHAAEEILFDTESTDYAGLTRSVQNYLNAITNDGTMVGWGTAPYTKTTFTNSDDKEIYQFETPWFSRGVVIKPNGDRVILEPAETQYGGLSKAMDIAKLDNGGYLVVGQSSISVSVSGQERYDELCKGESESVAVCRWSRQRSETFYNANAYSWKLDSDFNVIETKDLGLGVTRFDDEENAFVSGALAVNKNGIVVGFSPIRTTETNDNEKNGQVVAGYFKDGTFTAAPTVKRYYESGRAVDINDHNVMVGNQYREIPNNGRSTVGFYVDLDNNVEVDIQGYFLGSDVEVRSINNEGFIVGQAEVDKNTSNRRREAFIYQVGAEKITNINTLLPCKDPATGEAFRYTLAEANKITDGNVIYGSATKTIEKRNSLGEVVYNVDGVKEFESIVVPVMLTPVAGGQVESCTAAEIEPYERQSASWGWLSLMLLPLVGWRRLRQTH
ncbi:hypothetical protein PALB_27430 [Pseudoalteromonas luteoviolacea B = ATCC 29581]|nr:hypothetical protein PALB_27430 [Pseudoalteromonas luteoviolacea B = ATCC 29581]